MLMRQQFCSLATSPIFDSGSAGENGSYVYVWEGGWGGGGETGGTWGEGKKGGERDGEKQGGKDRENKGRK